MISFFRAFPVILLAVLSGYPLYCHGESGGASDNNVAPISVPLTVLVDEDFLKDATESELRERVAQYVEDINKIFAKNTIRRFTYDPKINFRTFPDERDPVTHIGTSVYSGGTAPDTRRYAIAISKSGKGTVTGYGNAGALCVRKWVPEPCYETAWLRATDKIWPTSVTKVPQNSLHDYTRDITVLAHELGHLHGLGTPVEWYMLTGFTDTTGIEPEILIKSQNYRIPHGTYLLTRSSILSDPMHGMDYGNANVFSPLSAALIGMSARSDGRYVPSGQKAFQYSARVPRPSDILSVLQPKIKINVKNQQGQPLVGCRVRIWGHETPSSWVWKHRLLQDGETLAEGKFEAPYVDPNDPNSNFARSIKVHCRGYKPAGELLTTYDMDAYYIMPNGGSDGDFRYRGSLTFALEQAPLFQNGRLRRDVNGDGYITPSDALAIFDALNLTGPRALPTSGNVPSYYYDVNGDGSLSSRDALEVINCLNDAKCLKRW